MATDGREFTISVQQSYPSAGAVTSPVGVTGTCTGTTSTTVLKDTGATFITDGIIGGEKITLDVGSETAKVVTVDSETQITSTTLSGAGTYDTGETYTIDGGYWAAGTYSFKVAAVYWATDVLEEDHGVIRTNVAAWAGHVVAAKDKVTITWTASERPPDHYNVYYVENATWTADTLRGRKIAEVNGHTLTATITQPYVHTGTCTGTTSTTVLKDTGASFTSADVGRYVILNVGGEYAKILTVDSGTQLTTNALTDSGTYDTGELYDVVYHIMPYSATARSFTLNPIKDVPPTVRRTMTRSYLGRLVRKSYALGSPLDAIDIEFYNTSITLANYHWLQLFIYHTTRCRITESSGASALISPMDGYFVNCSFLGSKHKNSRSIHSIRYECELGTVT